MSESHLFSNFVLSHVPHGGRTLKCEGVSIGNASHLKNHKMLILSLSKIRYIVLVGPLIENQAVTNSIVTAFSFALNTNLNTTPAQLISAAIDSRYVYALVFKFCVQTMAGELQIDDFPYPNRQ